MEEMNNVIEKAAEQAAEKGEGSLVKTIVVFGAGVLTGVAGTLGFKKLGQRKTRSLPRKPFWKKAEPIEEVLDNDEEPQE